MPAVLRDHNVTVVEIGHWVEIDGEPTYMSAVGSAQRHPADTYNREVGDLLAHARALKKLARKLDRRAAGLIKHADDMVAYKATKADPVDEISQFYVSGGMYELPDGTRVRGRIAAENYYYGRILNGVA